MSNPTTFGQWLKQRRKALGLTQKELARRAGCAEITLRKIEAGDLHASAPLVASLTKVAGAADADLPNLLSLARGAGDDFTTRARLLRPQRANNLPAQLTPLIGREHDIIAVRKRLLSDGARLVTLLGPPGVGKTRLALAVAEDVLEQFEHGAFFVRLGPVSDPWRRSTCCWRWTTSSRSWRPRRWWTTCCGAVRGCMCWSPAASRCGCAASGRWPCAPWLCRSRSPAPAG